MAVSKLEKQIFVTRNISVAYTASANGNGSLNLYAAATLSGYTPIGVLGYKTNSRAMYVVNVSLDNSNTGVFMRNTANDSVSENFEATILYQKN